VQVLEDGESKAVSTVGKKRIRLVEDILNKKPSNYTWGSLDIDEFIQKITQEGITDAKVEQVASGYIIHLVQFINSYSIYFFRSH
jgi:glutaredoxin 2